MVSLNNLLPNGNKQQNNVAVNYSENLNASESLLRNPNYNKSTEIQKHGPDNTYNIDVHYSTDLTHPELAPQNPVPNPVLERTKTLSPVQTISIIGRGVDPEVIANNPNNINPYVREKEKPTETQTLIKPQTTETAITQPISISLEKVFGPFYHGQNAQDVQEVLQITNGLTLPEIFNILSQYGININNWANANITISGNKIILNYTYSGPLESVLPNQSGPVGNITKNYTLEIENVKGWVVVKYKVYQTGTYEGTPFSPSLNENYYVINPITKKIAFTGPDISEAVIWKQPLMSPSDAINGALSQYGYTLAYGDIEKVNNLQPGQSITVYAIGNPSKGNPYGAQVKIINLGNGQYEIQSTTPLYDNGQWINIDESVNIPTVTENVLTGSISTTNYNIVGYNTLQSSGSLNATKLATYEISESYPITYKVNNNQITFQFGNPTVDNTSLQSINVPTLTYQEYIQLANGQMPPGIKPGWYYYPTLHEFVYVTPPQYTLNVGNIKITNQEVLNFIQQYGNNNVLVTNLGNIGNPNELAFIYLTPNGNGQMLIYNTSTDQVVDIVPIKNLQTGNPNYDLITQMIYNQQYNGFGMLYPGNNELITFQLVNPNNLNSYVTNEPAANIVGSTPVYLTVDLINNTIYLQNVSGQVISTKTFRDQKSMLDYLQKNYGINQSSVLQAENPILYNLSNIALNTAAAEAELEISIPLLTLTSASIFTGSLIGSTLLDIGTLNIDTSIPQFVKNFVISGSTTTALGNLTSYIFTGKPLSPAEDIFLFTTSGLIGTGSSILGNAISVDLTNAGITGLKNSFLSGLIENTIAGAGINVTFGETLSLHNTGKWLSPSEIEQYVITGAEYGALASIVGLGLGISGSNLLKNPLGSSLAAGTVNALFALPSKNPLMILGAFDIGLLSGGLDRIIEISKIPYLLESPEVQRVLDTTPKGWEIGNEIKERMLEAGLVTRDDTTGWTTTETISRLKEIYNNLQEKIIEKELSLQDIKYLRSKGILGIRNDIILGKEEDFAKYVKDKVSDGEKYYDAQQILKYIGKQLDKMFGGWKISFGEKTLLYSIKSGDKTIWGFGSAGKAEEFISERAVSDITLNVAGIYNAPSDVIDTIKYLRRIGMDTDAEILEKIYDSIKTVKDILSKIKPSKNIEIEFRDYAEEYTEKYGPEYGELVSTQMGDTIKEYIQENFGKDAVIYGSESVRQYLDDIAKRYGGEVIRVGKDYVVIDRYGNIIWKFRMPGDVDIIINTRDPGVLEKAAEDIAKLLNKTLKTDRFVAQDHLVIDKYRGGEHVVDLHMPNEGSEWLNVYARKSNFNDLGFQRPEPYHTDKVKVASLSQTLLDKASAVASLRQLSLADLVDAINSGAKIDNPDYVISFLKTLLKDADYETQRNVLSEFIIRLKPEYRNIYIGLISNSFNIPADQLTYVDLVYRDIVNQYFYKIQTYLAPATYRLKDTGDTLSLTYLGGKLAKSKEVMENYETIKEIAKEKGILPKDWTEPNEINMEDIFKSINPFESNIETSEMIRVGSMIGSLGSMFGSEESITGASIVLSLSNGLSTSNKSSSIRSMSLSESESIVSSSIVSTSESLTKSLSLGSLSSSLSESFSFSSSLSTSTSQSLSSSTFTSMSTSTSTSTSTSISTSLSSSISASIFSTSGSPSYFSSLILNGLSNPTTNIGIELGNAKWAELDVAYAFNKLWI